MSGFNFDNSADFKTNLESFLKHLASLDTEMTTILRTNIGKLEGIVDETQRTSIRGAFNESIITALESIIGSEEDEES